MKKKKKNNFFHGRYFVLCVSVFLLVFVGFAIWRYVPQKSAVVAILFSDVDVPRWQKESDRIAEQLTAKGYEVIVRFADGDLKLQAEQIQEVVALGARVVVVNPVDANNLVPVMRDAQAKGVKFIAHDRLILGGQLDYFTTIRMQDVGRIAAERYLLAKAGKNLVYIAGDPADTNAGFHHDGAMQALAYAIERGDVVVQGDLVTDWSTASAYSAMKEFLKNGKEVDAVIGGNDLIAQGAQKALAEAGIHGVFIAGGDADVAACRAILSGTQTITLYKPSLAIADASALIADHFMRGEKPPVYGLADNGFMHVPSSYVEPTVIDNTNVQIDGESCMPQGGK